MNIEFSEEFRKTIADILDLCVKSGTDSCVIEVEVKKDVKLMVDMKFSVEDKRKDGEFLIDENTICQYTGLHDKNGKRIWENDILMCHDNPKDLVKAVFGEFNVIEVESEEVIDSVIGWHYEVIPTDELSKCEPFCYSMPLTDTYIKLNEMEVVGNVYDNPELLEECNE